MNAEQKLKVLRKAFESEELAESKDFGLIPLMHTMYRISAYWVLIWKILICLKTMIWCFTLKTASTV